MDFPHIYKPQGRVLLYNTVTLPKTQHERKVQTMQKRTDRKPNKKEIEFLETVATLSHESKLILISLMEFLTEATEEEKQKLESIPGFNDKKWKKDTVNRITAFLEAWKKGREA